MKKVNILNYNAGEPVWEDYLVSRYDFNTDIGYLVMEDYDDSIIYVSRTNTKNGGITIMKTPKTTTDFEIKDIKAGDKLLRVTGGYDWWTQFGVYEVEYLHDDLVICSDDNDWYFVDDEYYIRDNFELVVEPPKEDTKGVVDFCIELLEDIERCDMTRNEIKMYLAGIVTGAEGEYK